MGFLKKQKALVVILATLLTLNLAGCKPNETTATAVVDPENNVITVNTFSAQTSEMKKEAEFVGKIEAKSLINVYAEIPGEVVTANFNVGDTVTAGQVLFQVDDEDLLTALELEALSYSNTANSTQSSVLAVEQGISSSADLYATAGEALRNLEDAYDDAKSAKNAAEKALVTAKAALATAEAENEAAKDAGSSVPHDEKALTTLNEAITNATIAVTQTTSAYAAASSAYDTNYETLKANKSIAYDNMQYAKESYDLVVGNDISGLDGTTSNTVKMAEISYNNALKNLEKATVTAPISGVITQKNVSVSGMASTQAPAYVIKQEGTQLISFNLSAQSMANLSMGDSVVVVYNGVDYPATIVEMSMEATIGTGLFAVKAETNEALPTTYSGTTVKVRVTTYQLDDIITVPLDSVYYDENQAYVLVKDGNTAVRKDIVTDISTSEEIVVIEGLQLGDEIISSWHPDLEDGATVAFKGEEVVASEVAESTSIEEDTSESQEQTDGEASTEAEGE